MEIKAYADRIRQEIKAIEKNYDYESTRHIMNELDGQQSMERCNYLRGKKDGLNKALDIYISLGISQVKEREENGN